MAKEFSIQNIETKRKGLRCPIRIVNMQGDGTLTTYDPAVEGSVEVAAQDLADFFDSCIAKFKTSNPDSKLTPNVWAKKVGDADFGMLTGDMIKAPEFDLGLYEDVMVQPVPITGG